MLSRALSLAAVMLLTGFATVPVQAQNLEAGKSPAQLFAGGCAVCHKSARGLLKTVPPGSLPSFLRQHYTTSTDMAAAMSAYVIANGAGGRGGDTLTRRGRELSTEQRPAPAEARPSDQPAAQAEPGPRKRGARRQPPPAEDAAKPAEAAAPAAAAEERPVGQKRLGRKGRRQQEEARPAAIREEPKPEAKSEPKVEPKAEPKVEPKPEARPQPKPAEERRPEPAAETPPLRPDPVPPVTPAPKAAEPETAPASPAPAPEPAAPAPSTTP